jgi:hypothetical protein
MGDRGITYDEPVDLSEYDRAFMPVQEETL